jgi:hypothetical protein
MRYLLLLLFCISISGCDSCTSKFYGTNNHSYLNILPDSTNLKDDYIIFFIDSVLNKNNFITDSIKSQFFISNDQKDLNSDDRIVYFKEYPEEWYLISFDATPCWIKAVYNNHLGNVAIFEPSQLTQYEFRRIKKRFQIEILNKATLYAKEKNIPDSVHYIK